MKFSDYRWVRVERPEGEPELWALAVPSAPEGGEFRGALAWVEAQAGFDEGKPHTWWCWKTAQGFEAGRLEPSRGIAQAKASARVRREHGFSRRAAVPGVVR